MRMDAETVLPEWSDIESEESQLSSNEDSQLSSNEDEGSDEEDPLDQTPSDYAGWREAVGLKGKSNG